MMWWKYTTQSFLSVFLAMLLICTLSTCSFRVPETTLLPPELSPSLPTQEMPRTIPVLPSPSTTSPIPRRSPLPLQPSSTPTLTTSEQARVEAARTSVNTLVINGTHVFSILHDQLIIYEKLSPIDWHIIAHLTFSLSPYDTILNAILAEGLLYIESERQLHVIDVHDPYTPHLRDTMILPLGGGHIWVDKDRVYIATASSRAYIDYDLRITVIDATDSSHLHQESLITFDEAKGSSVRVAQHTAFIVSPYPYIGPGGSAYTQEDHVTGLYIYDLTAAISPTVIARLPIAPPPYGLVKKDNTLYIKSADFTFRSGYTFVNEAKVVLVDVQDRYHPKIISEITTPDTVSTLYVQLPYIYLFFNNGRGNYLLQVIDMSDFNHPVLSMEYVLPGWVSDITGEPPLLYIAAYNAGIYVLDITDPQSIIVHRIHDH